jgi:hypothetical protein
MPTFYLTRREHFNAAHKLYNPQWTVEQNNEVFGKCANENWHGHNFELFVTVKGAPDPDTGFIVDAKLLSKIIKEFVVKSGITQKTCHPRTCFVTPLPLISNSKTGKTKLVISSI